jgi:hypothetical protein
LKTIIREPAERFAEERQICRLCLPISHSFSYPTLENTLGAICGSLSVNREIGFIFQSFNLIGDLMVFENVELPLTYRGITKSG